MSLYSKRSVLVGIAALIIGIATFAAIWGTPSFGTSSTTLKGQVAAYLLDDSGAVEGLLLTSGDQLRFNSQTGQAVSAQIKVGDEVTATGRAGEQSNYGRELRVEQISAGGHTIIEAKQKRKRPHGKREAKDHGDRNAEPPQTSAPAEATTDSNAAPGSNAEANKPESVQPTPVELLKAAGTIKAHLVNAHGDVIGLIMSGGEQMRFSAKVGEMVVASEQGADTQVIVEGTGVRNERGTVIRPSLITIGNKTITLGR